MNHSLYLLWHSYRTQDIITIGLLQKKENQYSFQYGKGALLGLSQGCLLPFPYREQTYFFPKLPAFFERRKLDEKRRRMLGIHCDNDDLSILASTHGRLNSDNFIMITEEEYRKFCKEGKQKVMS